MSGRGERPRIAKYMVKVYKFPRQPQLNVRLKSQPPRYGLYVTNGSTNVYRDLQHATLRNIAVVMKDFILEQNRSHDNHTIFHYAARTPESVPHHLRKAGLPITLEEWQEFHHYIHRPLNNHRMH